MYGQYIKHSCTAYRYSYSCTADTVEEVCVAECRAAASIGSIGCVGRALWAAEWRSHCAQRLSAQAEAVSE